MEHIQEPPVNFREVPHISLEVVYLGIIILERVQGSIPPELVNILEQVHTTLEELE